MAATALLLLLPLLGKGFLVGEGILGALALLRAQMVVCEWGVDVGRPAAGPRPGGGGGEEWGLEIERVLESVAETIWR